MAAYHQVYDSHHLQAERTGISSGTLRSVIEYGLPLPFFTVESHEYRPCGCDHVAMVTLPCLGCAASRRYTRQSGASTDQQLQQQ